MARRGVRRDTNAASRAGDLETGRRRCGSRSVGAFGPNERRVDVDMHGGEFARNVASQLVRELELALLYRASLLGLDIIEERSGPHVEVSGEGDSNCFHFPPFRCSSASEPMPARVFATVQD